MMIFRLIVFATFLNLVLGDASRFVSNRIPPPASYLLFDYGLPFNGATYYNLQVPPVWSFNGTGYDGTGAVNLNNGNGIFYYPVNPLEPSRLGLIYSEISIRAVFMFPSSPVANKTIFELAATFDNGYSWDYRNVIRIMAVGTQPTSTTKTPLSVTQNNLQVRVYQNGISCESSNKGCALDLPGFFLPGNYYDLILSFFADGFANLYSNATLMARSLPFRLNPQQVYGLSIGRSLFSGVSDDTANILMREVAVFNTSLSTKMVRSLTLMKQFDYQNLYASTYERNVYNSNFNFQYQNDNQIDTLYMPQPPYISVAQIPLTPETYRYDFSTKDDLIPDWRFNNVTVNLVNNATWQLDALGTPNVNAIVFHDNNSYAFLSSSSIAPNLIGGPSTFEFKYKFNASVPVSANTILFACSADNNGIEVNRLALYTTTASPDNLTFSITLGEQDTFSMNVNVSGPYSMPDYALGWYHILLTVNDDGTVLFFNNGYLLATQVLAIPYLASRNHCYLGRDTNLPFNKAHAILNFYNNAFPPCSRNCAPNPPLSKFANMTFNVTKYVPFVGAFAYVSIRPYTLSYSEVSGMLLPNNTESIPLYSPQAFSIDFNNPYFIPDDRAASDLRRNGTYWQVNSTSASPSSIYSETVKESSSPAFSPASSQSSSSSTPSDTALSTAMSQNQMTPVLNQFQGSMVCNNGGYLNLGPDLAFGGSSTAVRIEALFTDQLVANATILYSANSLTIPLDAFIISIGKTWGYSADLVIQVWQNGYICVNSTSCMLTIPGVLHINQMIDLIIVMSSGNTLVYLNSFLIGRTNILIAPPLVQRQYSFIGYSPNKPSQNMTIYSFSLLDKPLSPLEISMMNPGNASTYNYQFSTDAPEGYYTYWNRNPTLDNPLNPPITYPLLINAIWSSNPFKYPEGYPSDGTSPDPNNNPVTSGIYLNNIGLTGDPSLQNQVEKDQKDFENLQQQQQELSWFINNVTADVLPMLNSAQLSISLLQYMKSPSSLFNNISVNFTDRVNSCYDSLATSPSAGPSTNSPITTMSVSSASPTVNSAVYPSGTSSPSASTSPSDIPSTLPITLSSGVPSSSPSGTTTAPPSGTTILPSDTPGPAPTSSPSLDPCDSLLAQLLQSTTRYLRYQSAKLESINHQLNTAQDKLMTDQAIYSHSFSPSYLDLGPIYVGGAGSYHFKVAVHLNVSQSAPVPILYFTNDKQQDGVLFELYGPPEAQIIICTVFRGYGLQESFHSAPLDGSRYYLDLFFTMDTFGNVRLFNYGQLNSYGTLWTPIPGIRTHAYVGARNHEDQTWTYLSNSTFQKFQYFPNLMSASDIMPIYAYDKPPVVPNSTTSPLYVISSQVIGSFQWRPPGDLPDVCGMCQEFSGNGNCQVECGTRSDFNLIQFRVVAMYDEYLKKFQHLALTPFPPLKFNSSLYLFAGQTYGWYNLDQMVQKNIDLGADYWNYFDYSVKNPLGVRLKYQNNYYDLLPACGSLAPYTKGEGFNPIDMLLQNISLPTICERATDDSYLNTYVYPNPLPLNQSYFDFTSFIHKYYLTPQNRYSDKSSGTSPGARIVQIQFTEPTLIIFNNRESDPNKQFTLVENEDIDSQTHGSCDGMDCALNPNFSDAVKHKIQSFQSLADIGKVLFINPPNILFQYAGPALTGLVPTTDSGDAQIDIRNATAQELNLLGLMRYNVFSKSTAQDASSTSKFITTVKLQANEYITSVESFCNYRFKLTTNFDQVIKIGYASNFIANIDTCFASITDGDGNIYDHLTYTDNGFSLQWLTGTRGGMFQWQYIFQQTPQSYSMYNVVFDFDASSALSNSKPTQAISLDMYNHSPIAQTCWMTHSLSLTNEQSYSNTDTKDTSYNYGVSYTVQGGQTTDVANLHLSLSDSFTGNFGGGFSTSFASTYGSSNSTTQDDTQMLMSNVPPNSKVTANLLAFTGSIDIPYTADVLITYVGGMSEHVITHGIYSNVRTTSIIVTYSDAKPIGDGTIAPGSNDATSSSGTGSNAKYPF